jgi:hypothetical protein
MIAGNLQWRWAENQYGGFSLFSNCAADWLPRVLVWTWNGKRISKIVMIFRCNIIRQSWKVLNQAWRGSSLNQALCISDNSGHHTRYGVLGTGFPNRTFVSLWCECNPHKNVRKELAFYLKC